MSDIGTWLTNDPDVTKRLRAIDRKYLLARKAALPLAFHPKVEALRKAAHERDEALAKIKDDLAASRLAPL